MENLGERETQFFSVFLKLFVLPKDVYQIVANLLYFKNVWNTYFRKISTSAVKYTQYLKKVQKFGGFSCAIIFPAFRELHYPTYH